MTISRIILAFTLLVAAAPAWAQNGVFRRPCVSPGSPPGCDAVPGAPGPFPALEPHPDRSQRSTTLLQTTPAAREETTQKPTEGTVTLNPGAAPQGPQGAPPKGAPAHPAPPGPQPAAPPPPQ